MNLLLDRANPLYEAPIEKLHIMVRFSDKASLFNLLLSFFHGCEQINKLTLSLYNTDGKVDLDSRQRILSLVKELSNDKLQVCPEYPKEIRLDYEGEIPAPAVLLTSWDALSWEEV